MEFLLKECLAQAGVSVEFTKSEVDALIDHVKFCANTFASARKTLTCGSGDSDSDSGYSGAIMFDLHGIQATEEIVKCLQPLADIVRSRSAFFSSEGASLARRRFWLQFLKGLPRVERKAQASDTSAPFSSWGFSREDNYFRYLRNIDTTTMGRGSCREDALAMFVVEQWLLRDKVSPPLLNEKARHGRDKRLYADLDCATPRDIGMSGKRTCVQHGYCEGFVARSSELTSPPSNEQPEFAESMKLRHRREAEELEFDCEGEASRFQVLQQDLHNAWKIGLEYWIPLFTKHQDQRCEEHCAKVFRDLQDKHVSRRMALKEQHLKELFPPVILVTNSQMSVLNGCYELKVDSLTEAIPVYQQWRQPTGSQHRWLYKATSQQWCISDLQDKDQRLPNGWAHSSAVKETSSPVQATGWRVQQDEKWQPSGLVITVLPDSGMELVVVSLAGVELLRKTFRPSATVADAKGYIEKKHPQSTIKLSHHGRILTDRRQVGSIGLGPGEVIQAVVQPTGKRSSANRVVNSA